MIESKFYIKEYDLSISKSSMDSNDFCLKRRLWREGVNDLFAGGRRSDSVPYRRTAENTRGIVEPIQTKGGTVEV